jgi:hypothetical protein
LQKKLLGDTKDINFDTQNQYIQVKDADAIIIRSENKRSKITTLFFQNQKVIKNQRV